MAEGITPDLLFVAAVTFMAGSILLVRRLPLLLACLLAAIKITIPLIYFSVYFDGTWTFLDDWTYFRTGRSLLVAGHNPENILFRKDGLIALGSAAGSQHFLYYWWNMVTFRLFGVHYYSPVFMNVCLTFIAGIYLFRTAEKLGMSKRYCQWLLIFFLLNWDVLSWSSVANVKDLSVMTLTSFSLYHFMEFGVLGRKDYSRFFSLVLALIAFFTLGFIRFYVPVLMISSFGLWLWLHRTGTTRLVITGLILLFAVYVMSRYGAIAGDSELTKSPVGIASGLVRFMLTPRPWGIEAQYAFLSIAAVMHWLFLVPVISSARAFWFMSIQHRFIVIYVVIACLFYTIVPELQGPRGRVQLGCLWAWLQFHCLVSLYRSWNGATAEPNHRGDNAYPHNQTA